MVLYSFDKELYENDLKQTAFEKGEQIGLEKGEQIGLEKGEQIGKQNKLISQVQKKLAKGKSVEEIADALEESIETIQHIIDTLQ